MCVGSCAAGGGVYPAGVQGLLRHLEELLATPPLAGLGSARGVAPGRQELQVVDLNDGNFSSTGQRSTCFVDIVQAQQNHTEQLGKTKRNFKKKVM